MLLQRAARKEEKLSQINANNNSYSDISILVIKIIIKKTKQRNETVLCAAQSEITYFRGLYRIYIYYMLAILIDANLPRKMILRHDQSNQTLHSLHETSHHINIFYFFETIRSDLVQQKAGIIIILFP